MNFRSQNLVPAEAKKAFDGVADQDGTGIAGEEQDSVFQIGHDLVEVLLQCGEDLLNIAHATAEALDLVGDLHDGVVGGVRFKLPDSLGLSKGVETLADLGQRLERRGWPGMPRPAAPRRSRDWRRSRPQRAAA